MEVAPDPNASVPPTESNANTGNASFGLFAGRFKKRFKNGAEEKKSARRTTGGGTTGSFGVTGKDSPGDGDASFETIACDRGVLRDECLTCPYHGWTYDLTGALVKVPRLAGTEAFETNENGLREIAVSVWGPFVWCAFLDDSSSKRGDENDVDVTDTTSPVTDTTSPGIVPPVAEWLGAGGAFLARCGSVPSGDREPLRFVTKRAYRVNCNWKVFVDNYLDGGYHVPVAHPALASGIDMKTYETRVEGNTVTQIVLPSTEKKKETEETMNRRMTGVDHTSATYAYVYPNFMVNRYGPWMDTNLVTPTSATTCVVTFEYFLEPAFLNDAAFVRDSLALCQAFAWLRGALVERRERVDECAAAARVAQLRRAQRGCVGDSFPTISSAGANAGICVGKVTNASRGRRRRAPYASAPGGFRRGADTSAPLAVARRVHMPAGVAWLLVKTRRRTHQPK